MNTSHLFPKTGIIVFLYRESKGKSPQIVAGKLCFSAKEIGSFVCHTSDFRGNKFWDYVTLLNRDGSPYGI